MRGEILQYDDAAGAGLISGDDGVRYSFRRADLQQLKPLTRGMRVDFVPKEGAAAGEIFVLDAGGVGAGGASALESSNEDLSLWGYFTKCMRLSFNGVGRARRKEYWSFVLFEVIFVFFAIMIAAIVAGVTQQQGYTYGSSPAAIGIVIAAGLLVFAFVPAAITVAIRRLHDVGLTGWLVLVALIPYIGGIFLFIVALIPSERRTNAHGLYPKPL